MYHTAKITAREIGELVYRQLKSVCDDPEMSAEWSPLDFNIIIRRAGKPVTRVLFYTEENSWPTYRSDDPYWIQFGMEILQQKEDGAWDVKWNDGCEQFYQNIPFWAGVVAGRLQALLV